MNVQTFDTEKFRNTALFSVKLGKWGNRAKVKDGKKLAEYLALCALAEGNETASRIEGSTNTKRVKATKILLKSEALDAVNEHMNATKKRCLALCMPSFREGMFVASLLSHNGQPSPVAQINAIMEEASAKLRDELLPELEIDLPRALENALKSPVKEIEKIVDGEPVKENGNPVMTWIIDPDGGLGPIFDASDYPRIRDEGNVETPADDLELDTAKIAECFRFEWNWLALTVPEGLPPELRAQETEKLQRQFSDAAQEMRFALRTMFAELVTHAADTLKTGEDGKKKIFRDTLTGNLNDFFAAFQARNIMGDDELSALVTRCREVMTNDGNAIDPDALRKDDGLRDLTAKKLDEIKNALAPLVAELPERTFDFSQ